jgi:membrane-associated phospholipid phosphatase
MNLIIRLAALAAVVVLWMAGYTMAPSLALWSPVLLEGDPVRHLPVLTPFVLPYLSFYLMPALLFLSKSDRADLWPMVRGFLLIIAVSTVAFIVLPTVIMRPNVTAEWHFGGWLLKVVHANDTNSNCFPSEHVSVATYCCLALGRLRPNLRWGWWIWGALVVLSTIFTRQHYVADVIGGLIVAFLGWRFARLRPPTASS